MPAARALCRPRSLPRGHPGDLEANGNHNAPNALPPGGQAGKKQENYRAHDVSVHFYIFD